MADSTVLASQLKFLRAGGPLELPLQRLRDAGLLPPEGLRQNGQEWQEYPKYLPLPGNPLVNSEEEEERVMAGGATSEQIEDQRQFLINKARGHGIHVDANWSIVRLKRELGEELDKAPVVEDRMARLEAELAYERKIADMEAEIAALKARRGPSEDEMRAELTALGVKVDGRWSAARLRDELATAKGE